MKKHSVIWIGVTAATVLVVIQIFVTLASTAAIEAGLTPIELFLPKPTDTFVSAISNAELILTELAYTLARAVIGLVLGLCLALGIVFIGSLNRTIKTNARLVAYSVNAFPLVGFAPLIILIFGQGSDLGMIFLAMLLSYFPVYISIEHAISNIPMGLRDIGRMLKISPMKEFKVILLPEIRGSIMNSLRLAVPASIVGATIGEWLGAQHGVGRLVTVSLYQFNAQLMYAALLYVVVFNILFLIALHFLEKTLVVPRK